MPQVLAVADFEVEFVDYTAGQVINFSDAGVAASLVSRRVVIRDGSAIAQAIANGASEVTHVAGSPSGAGLELVRVDRSGTLRRSSGQVVGVEVVYAPPSTGNDQTSELQELFSDTYSDLMAGRWGGLKPEIIFPDHEYMVNGLTIEQKTRYNFGSASFKKTQNGGGAFDNPFGAVLRTRLQQTAGSWFGQADDIEIVGGTFDCNNKICGAGIINLFNVRNFKATDLTAVHASVPWAGGFAWMLGGQNIELVNPGVRKGEFVGHDGIHVFFCDNLTSLGGYSEGGDDFIAFGMEPWAEAWCDDIGLENYQVFGLRGRSMRTAAVKIYVPVQGISSGTKRGRHRKGRVFVTGNSGIKRGGGVFVQNEVTSSPDVTMISDVKVYADLQIGGASHDGINAYGVQVNNATNVQVEGQFRFTDIANATRGYQTVSSSALYSSLTGLVAGTTYNFGVSIDGAAAITVSVLGSAAQTWGALFEVIAATPALTAVADVEWEGGRIKFISKTTGASSTVLVTAGTLFVGGTLSSFTAIDTATPGQASPRFSVGNINNNRKLLTDIRVEVAPGGEGYLYNNTTDWIARGVLNGIQNGRFAFKATPGGTSTSLDASGFVAAGVSGSGFLDPGTGRTARFTMFGGNVEGCTVKINNTTPATFYSISGVAGINSLVGGTAQIASGQTEVSVTPNCTPRLAYSAGSPFRSLQQVSVRPVTTGAPFPALAEVSDNQFRLVLPSAAASTWTYAWQVNSGFNAT